MFWVYYMSVAMMQDCGLTAVERYVHVVTIKVSPVFVLEGVVQVHYQTPGLVGPC